MGPGDSGGRVLIMYSICGVCGGEESGEIIVVENNGIHG